MLRAATSLCMCPLRVRWYMPREICPAIITRFWVVRTWGGCIEKGGHSNTKGENRQGGDEVKRIERKGRDEKRKSRRGKRKKSWKRLKEWSEDSKRSDDDATPNTYLCMETRLHRTCIYVWRHG